jgi:hypothetical protein
MNIDYISKSIGSGIFSLLGRSARTREGNSIKLPRQNHIKITTRLPSKRCGKMEVKTRIAKHLI